MRRNKWGNGDDRIYFQGFQTPEFFAELERKEILGTLEGAEEDELEIMRQKHRTNLIPEKYWRLIDELLDCYTVEYYFNHPDKIPINNDAGTKGKLIALISSYANLEEYCWCEVYEIMKKLNIKPRG